MPLGSPLAHAAILSPVISKIHSAAQIKRLLDFLLKTFFYYNTAIKALNLKFVLEFTLSFQVYTAIFIFTIPCELKL